MKYDVIVRGRAAGAIGVHNTMSRRVTVEAPTLDDVAMAAFRAVDAIGGMEHLSVRQVALHGDYAHGDATHNPNCDGGHCHTMIGEVRVYPLGGGGNLHLCCDCWEHENAYRRRRGKETGEPNNWPPLNWYGAKGWDAVYGQAYECCRT